MFKAVLPCLVQRRGRLPDGGSHSRGAGMGHLSWAMFQ